VGHLHRAKSLAGAHGSRPAAPGASIYVSDTFHIHSGAVFNSTEIRVGAALVDKADML